MTPPDLLADVTGIVLVGGLSRRLGQDKVLLPVGGEPLVASIRRVMATVFPKVLLVGHHRSEFEPLGLHTVEDLLPDGGALGGIYTGLSAAETPFVFAVACDMPFLDPLLIREVCTHRGGVDAVVPWGPRGLEPLLAVYARSCLRSMQESLGAGNRRILEALKGLRVATPTISLEGRTRDPFANINTPEDLTVLEA